MCNEFAIVADIGGTFARFSRVDLSTLALDKIAIYPCDDFDGLEVVLTKYRMEQQLSAIEHVAIAIACPVLGDVISMTNRAWQFSVSELKRQFKLSTLLVMNDFTAIAMSIPVLNSNLLKQLGTGEIDPTRPKVVLGAGTGLGVAYLIPSATQYVPYAGEGGHANWGARTEQEWLIFEYIQRKHGRVSYERVLSGQGIENIYQALSSNNDCLNKRAQDIIALALTDQCDVAKTTIKQFFTSLASFAGDLALTFGALGGVYIGGGIVLRLLPLLDIKQFRSQFEDKGRFSEFNSKIPTYLITAEQPGLLGAAVKLKYALQGEFHVLS